MRADRLLQRCLHKIRYSINGVITAGDDPAEIESEFNMAIAGAAIEYDGLFVLRPGANRPIQYSIGADDLIDEPALLIGPRQSERVNILRASLGQDAAFDYQTNGVPEIRDDASIGRDGEDLPVDLGSLRFVNDQEQAQFLLAVALRQHRAPEQIKIEVRPGENLEHLAITPGDIIGLTIEEFGFEDSRFQVSRIETQPGQSVVLDLFQSPDDLYSLPTFQQAPLPAARIIPVDPVSIPSGVVITTEGSGEFTTAGRIDVRVSWARRPYSTFATFRPRQGRILQHQIQALPVATAGSVRLGIGVYDVSIVHYDAENGLFSLPYTTTHEITAADLPAPPTPRLIEAGQIGRGFRLKYVPGLKSPELFSPDPAGIDVRFVRRDFGSSNELTPLTENNWDTGERLISAAIPPEADLTSAIVADGVVEADGEYMIQARAVNVFGARSPILEIGRFNLRRADQTTFQDEASPTFPGDKTDAAVYTRPDETAVLLPTRTDLASMSFNDWNGSGTGGWPFGGEDDSVYQSEFIDFNEVRGITISLNTMSFVPTGDTPDSPTLEVIHKDVSAGAETIVEVEANTDTSINARFVAFRITFSGQGLTTASATGRYDDI